MKVSSTTFYAAYLQRQREARRILRERVEKVRKNAAACGIGSALLDQIPLSSACIPQEFYVRSVRFHSPFGTWKGSGILLWPGDVLSVYWEGSLQKPTPVLARMSRNGVVTTFRCRKDGGRRTGRSSSSSRK